MSIIVSLDRTGRIVLPKSVREQFNLHPGSQIEIKTKQDYLELKPVDATPALVSRERLLVHQGASQAPLAGAIEQSREERVGILSKRFTG